MLQKVFAFMRYRYCFLVIFMLLSVLLLTSPVMAESKGMIIGRVVDSDGNGYLPGANIMLRGTILGASTDREGVFVIKDVPMGTYNLVVSYIGYEDYTTQVTVSESDYVVRMPEIPLKISALQTDEVVVEGQMEGQIKALNQQRVAANIKNVVAREQMELFPDYTTADAVRRLPGVYIGQDQGEGRYVLVRGTEPRLNNVKVNGEELATSRVEERYTQLDIIGSNQMASIEVVKALTPDMDGDAIGGTVNLITRSPFDYPGMRLRATAGSGYSNLRGNPIYQTKFNFSNRFGPNRNFGVNITANWDRTDKGVHNSEKGWGSETDINDNEIPFALQEMDFRDYYNTRDRYGLGGGFEYRPTIEHRFFINGMYNYFNDYQERARKRFRIDRGDYQDPQGTIVEGTRIVVQSEVRTEKLLQTQFSAGGMHEFGQNFLDYKFAYSYAREQHPDQIESEFEERGIDMKLDFSDPQFPKFSVTNGVDIYDPSIYDLQGIDYRETQASDKNLVFATNFKMPFTLSNLSSELKFGGKLRMKRKDRGDTRYGYSWEGPTVTLADLASTRETTDFLNGNYRYGPQPDADMVEDFFRANRDVQGALEGELDYWDSMGQTYSAKENIYAGYGMGTFNLSKMMLLLGARYETTNNDYNGTILVFDDQGDFSSASDTTGKRDVGYLLPMVHFKYELNRMSNLRLAVTRTIARPNYFDLVPFLSINPDNEEIRQGNSELKTTEAWNFDLMGEHYFLGVGVVSGGFFYKALDNIIFELRGPITDQNSTYYNWDFRGPVNGGKATLYGFELNWQQRLTFLHGIWSGFGIYANYAKTWATSDLIPEQREDVNALPGQAGDVGNVALSYERGKFSGRVSMMYQNKYLIEVGAAEDGNQDQWRASHLQFDVSAFYKLIQQLDVFAEFVNVTNEPKVEYIGVASRPILQEYYSWWMRAGVRLSL